MICHPSDAPCFRPTGWAWQWLTCPMPMPTINRKFLKFLTQLVVY